jgi:prepilin-type N-terminal cleavage/methylation domain-containing protein
MFRKLRQVRGVTMVELMAAVVIIGVVTSMAAPQFEQAIQRIKFRTETKNILSTLRTARSHAIAEKNQYGVHFDGNSFVITLFKDIANLSNFIYDSGTDSILRVDTLPVEFTYLYASFTNSAVVYAANGTACATGDIFLMSTPGATVNLSQLNVLASTGRSKIQYIHNY